MKKTCLFIFLLVFIFKNNLYSNDFLVKPKHNSKNNRSKYLIKEDIGFSLKSLLNTTIDLNKEIAEIQLVVNKIEKNVLTATSNLVENKPPFKKSKRSELNNSLTLLNNLNHEILYYKDKLNALKDRIKQNSLLGNSN